MSNTYYQRPNNSGKNNNDGISQRYEYHRQQRVREPGSAKDLIANIVLVLLSITLVIAFLGLCSELRYVDNYYEKSASSFWWDYESGRYVDSIASRYTNTFRGVKETAELRQCYAVSEYFEAASLYKVAVFTDNSDKAQKYLDKMAKAYSEMGDVSYLADDIDTRLGIADIVK